MKYWTQFDKCDLDAMHGIEEEIDDCKEIEVEQTEEDDGLDWKEYRCCGGHGCSSCLMCG